MFYSSSILLRSTLLDSPRVAHGFSTRLGGVSVLPHTSSMNLTKGLGDPDETVLRNTEIFARAVSNGAYGNASVVRTHQIHSAKVRIVTKANVGEGVTLPIPEDGSCDGFVTDVPGVMPVITVADCAPVLLCGVKSDGSPVIASVHAGWRGTVDGIVCEAAAVMRSLGCENSSIRAAIGAHIGSCCYEVGEDFREAVIAARGADFARRHVHPSPEGKAGKYRADLTGMNRELLSLAGVAEERVDCSPECTMCAPEKFHSHRATGGKRGTMGAGIVILEQGAGIPSA